MDTFNVTHPANLMVAIIHGTTGMIGAPGNLVLLTIILTDYKNRKPHDWLLFALASSDFLFCFNSATLELAFITNFERVECKIAGALCYSSGSISFLTPSLVAYNRYLSLYHQQKYKKVFTNRNVFLALSVIWLFGLAWVSPFIATGSLGQDDLGVCGIQMRNYYLLADALGCFLIFFVADSFFVYFSYKVVQKIRNHKNAVAQSQIQSQLIKESKELITAMLVVSVVPLFSQLPGSFVKGLRIALPEMSPWFTRAIMAPFPLTMAMNAYITTYVVKEYRKKFLSLWKKVWNFKNKNQLQPTTAVNNRAVSQI